jgi:hypothetical protein
VYELFENLECSSVNVYDVATADEEEGGPIYAQARPQPILGEPAYRLTYLTKCEVSTTCEGDTSEEIGAGCYPDDETGYSRIDADHETGYSRIDADPGELNPRYSRLQWGVDAGPGEQSRYSRLCWGSDAAPDEPDEPVYSHLLRNAEGDDVDENGYSHIVCNSAGVRVLVEDADEASDSPHCKNEGVGEDDWATVMGSQVRRNGVRSGSRGSWSTVGSTEGVSLIEKLQQAQSRSGSPLASPRGSFSTVGTSSPRSSWSTLSTVGTVSTVSTTDSVRFSLIEEMEQRPQSATSASE